MPDEQNVPYGRKTQKAPKISEVHVLWLNDGMSCDGDSVSITAASDPSIEDIVLGAIPGLPKVHLHNRVLSYEVGDEMMQYFHKAANGELENFVVVIGRLDPERETERRGLLGGLWHQPDHGRTDPHHRMARSPRAESARRDRLRHLRHLWRHPCDERQSDGLHGPGGLPRQGLEIKDRAADRQRAGLPSATRQLHRNAALSVAPACRVGADDPGRRTRPADLAVRLYGASGLRSRRLLRAGRFRARIRLAQMSGQDRVLGPRR
jgi:hypothetical protein